jgi:predicted TIM-barrel fold metal-dependent hydrolase
MESNIDKFMFGSDFPANPKDINEIIEDILNLPMKDGSKEKLLYKNAEKVIDFS